MLITEKIVKDIFSLNLKLTNKEDKDDLSRFQELIPMYDIYSKQIYPIKKKNLHINLIEANYRFINQDIILWLKALYKKYKNDTISAPFYKKNLKIMRNYNIDLLLETSTKTLYENSPQLGLNITICKRESFHPLVFFLKPYYTLIELLKLGKNNGLVPSDLSLETFVQVGTFDLCKRISNKDISHKEITSHIVHIIKHDCISWITFYSFYGSFLFNKHLRNPTKKINEFLLKGITKITDVIKSAPSLKNNYNIYRFLWDDAFLDKLKINEIFTDLGFLSTTRDPFYSPALNGIFGLILIKINIPKDLLGVGLLIENFSLFQKEEEFLLSPNIGLKLINKDNNFKYYHINQIFEDLINKKYEFEVVNRKIDIKLNLKIMNNYKIFDNFKEYESNSNNRNTIINEFIRGGDQFLINLNGIKYIVNYLWFDGTNNSSYNKLYYNKNSNGIIFSIFENGYPYLNIELGDEMVINYINKFYYYKDNKKELTDNLIDLIYEFGRIFCYPKVKIFHCYRNFINFKKPEHENIYYYTFFYNHTLYDYLKNGTKYLASEYITFPAGWYLIDALFNKKIKKEYFNLIQPDKKKKLKNLYFDIIENNFTKYQKFLEELSTIKKYTIVNKKKINLIKDDFLIFDVYEKLNSENRISNFRSIINDDPFPDDFKLIFRQPILRY